MVMTAQSTMKSKLHAFFTFSFHGDMCSVNTGNIFWGVGGHLSTLVIYLIAKSEASNTVVMATATWHKYYCHAAAQPY